VRHLRRDAGVPYPEGFAVLVVDRLCDVYVLAAFAALAAARHAPALGAGLATALAAVALAPPLLLLAPGLVARLGGAAARRFLAAVTRVPARRLAPAVALTVVTFLVTYVQGAMVARAMGLALPFIDVALALAVASLLALLPISISGVGPREAYFALLFPALGLTADQGIAFGLLVFAVIHATIALLGAVAWQAQPIKEHAP
jgi:glycosyltransferase 2 family protein